MLHSVITFIRKKLGWYQPGPNPQLVDKVAQ
jgi:hypothetical protein